MDTQNTKSTTLLVVITVLITSSVVGGIAYLMNSNSKLDAQRQALNQELQNVKQDFAKEVENLKAEIHEKKSESQPVIPAQNNTQTQETNLSVKASVSSLYKNDRLEYQAWKDVFTATHKNLSVYDAGSYVELSNGNKIVTFSYFASEDPQSAGQVVVLFDANNNVIRETKGLQCKAFGDVPTPVIDSVKDNKIYVSCTAGDAGLIKQEKFEIDISNFGFRKI